MTKDREVPALRSPPRRKGAKSMTTETETQGGDMTQTMIWVGAMLVVVVVLAYMFA
jgi:hypothetical protein